MVIKSKDYLIKAGMIRLALVTDSKAHTWLQDIRTKYPHKLEGIINKHLDEIIEEINKRYEWSK